MRRAPGPATRTCEEAPKAPCGSVFWSRKPPSLLSAVLSEPSEPVSVSGARPELGRETGRFGPADGGRIPPDDGGRMPAVTAELFATGPCAIMRSRRRCAASSRCCASRFELGSAASDSRFPDRSGLSSSSDGFSAAPYMVLLYSENWFESGRWPRPAGPAPAALRPKVRAETGRMSIASGSAALCGRCIGASPCAVGWYSCRCGPGCPAAAAPPPGVPGLPRRAESGRVSGAPADGRACCTGA